MHRVLAEDVAAERDRPTAMVGVSDVFLRVRALLQRYARCDAPVLIEGETGTGKELAAREIHYVSARRLGPFVPINCGALPESLLESELFGHRRGAFTDARSDEPGLVECARGGTLFLDEIDSLPPRAQTTLLRFLQSGEFRAVGGRNLRTADVRVLAATNVSLTDAVEQSRFRRDLLYRLNALQVSLPPLRERGDDVVLLAKHLLEAACARLEHPPRQWAQGALAALRAHPWPGNVRELENVILRVCMRGDGETVGIAELAQADPALLRQRDAAAPLARHEANAPGAGDDELGDGERAPGDPCDVDDRDGSEPAAHFPDRPHPNRPRVESSRCEGSEDSDQGPHRSAFALAKRRAIFAFEHRYLIELMRRANGNISRAALLSGTERRQLGKMLKRHGLDHGAGHDPIARD